MGQIPSPCYSMLHTARRSLLACLLLLLAAGSAHAQSDRAASDAAPIEPPLETLQPKRPRSEAEEDRLAASVWFTQARLLLHRGDKPAALRAYQRAWRYDPQATMILSEIVSLAFELNHGEEAARYAVLAAEANPSDAILVRRLALYLADDRQWDRAVRLYERSLQLQPGMNEVTDLGSAVLHQEMGRLYFLSDQYAKSAASFAKVRDALAGEPAKLDLAARDIVLGKDPADTYSLWAESFLAAERYDEALALFEKGNSLDPNVGRIALQRARVAAARKDTTEALKRLDEFFATGDTSATLEPYLLLAALLEKQHADPKEAQQALIKRLEELRAARADDAALAYILTSKWIEADRLDEAEPLLQQTLARQPASEGYEQLVSLYQQRRQASQLARTLGNIVQKTGSLRIVDDQVARLAADAPLVEEMLQATRDQLKNDPVQLAGRQLFAMGLVALKAHQWDAAAEMFQAQIKVEPATKSDVLLTWGLGTYLADEYARAIEIFQRAIDEKAIGERAPAVYLSLAGALELNGRTDEAVAAVRKAIEIEPDNVSSAARLGWILYHAKRYDEAAQAYRELIEKYDSRHESAALRETLRDARLALSSVLLAQDKFDDAVELLEQVLDEYPEDAGAHNDLGYLWAERGLHLERSLAMTQKAVAAEPENASYLDSLGWAYFQLGRYSDAIGPLEKAAAGDDPGGVVLEHLGDAYAKLGRADKARSAWERALQAFQTEQETEKLEALRRKLADYKPEQKTSKD